jgi:oligosaccharyltransferase complex subunit alpha (ribophorin I)
MFVVNFNTPILKGQERRLVLYFVFAHAMTVYPDEITQNERQLVKYSDNHFFFSPYSTDEIITTVKLASSSVQSHTEKPPSIIKGEQIQYGPYKNIPPFSFSSLAIHFENNRPFITVINFLRLIEISHWGNVAVEDHITMRNDGARLKGSFSRYDYQINPQANGQSALKFLRQYLPAEAMDVYYRDDIGNISTSFLNMDDDDKHRLELRPRFPLFGGWKTEYYMGYNLPTESCLFIDDNGNYVLNTTLIANWDIGMAIDDAEVRIIFPEGSSKIKLVGTPFIVDQSNSIHFTYLDFFGRPVLILKKRNLVNEHHQYFQISYAFTSISLLLEPFLLIGGIAVVLISIILIRRIDLTIES